MDDSSENLDITEDLLERIKAYTPTIHAATVPIVALQNDKLVHDRTGVLYTVADHHFILTASHLVKNDLRSLQEIKISWYVSMNVDGVLPISLDGVKVYGTQVDGFDLAEEDARDIAVIHLPDKTACEIAKYKRFITHSEIDQHDGEETGFFIVVGYPMEWSAQKIGERYLYSRPLNYICRPFHGNVVPGSNYNSDFHFLLDFEQHAHNVQTGQGETLPEPDGISGCGVWRVSDGADRRNTQSIATGPTLVGIENKCSEGRNYLIATRIGWVMGRILDDCPELRPAMQLVYPHEDARSPILVPRRVAFH